MAGIKHTWGRSIKNDAGNSVVGETAVYTGTAEENFAIVAVADDDTDILIDIDKDSLVSYFLKSNKNVHVTCNTSGQEFDLVAGVARAWNTDLGAVSLSADITKFTFTNASLTDDATVVGGFLLSL